MLFCILVLNVRSYLISNVKKNVLVHAKKFHPFGFIKLCQHELGKLGCVIGLDPMTQI
jgi:hypothetical protein